MNKRILATILFLEFAMLMGFFSATLAHAQTTSFEVTGWLTILHGDAPPHREASSSTIYRLLGEDGQVYPLDVDETVLERNGGLLRLDRKRVRAELSDTSLAGTSGSYPVYELLSIQIDDPSDVTSSSLSAQLTGSQPWLSILCKFSDDPNMPQSLSYFQQMYSNTQPGLNHYWREVSNNTININNSNAVGWYTLPQPRSYYIYNNQLDFDRAAADCTAVADADVYFPNYVGINLMFNAELDGYAWGGGDCRILDGVFDCWAMTWLPPWGYQDITVVAHEMGHGFGLPHSSGTYGHVYDNVWDVMSDDWSYCYLATDPIYGCLGQHTISYHKDLLGWIPANRKYSVPYVASGNPSPIVLSASLPLVMAQIPILGSSTSFYTVEVRKTYAYDTKLPGTAVIIHEVDETRSEPAHVIDVDGNGNNGDAGAMWAVGEIFITPSISIEVLAVSGENYQVEVVNGVQQATFWLTPLGKPHPFADVSMFHGAYDSIMKIYTNGITGGCGTNPLIYCPDNYVTRAQMAIFLLRGIYGPSYAPPAATGTIFNDVTVSTPGAAWIEQLAREGITGGCGGGNYCPTSSVTRAQMAIFLLRSKYGASYTPSPPTGTMFSDVTTSTPGAAWIEQLAREGITSGCGGGMYCPASPVTRAQMAIFLARTFALP